MPARQNVLRPAVRQPISTAVKQPINAVYRQTIQPIKTAVAHPISALRQPVGVAAARPVSAFVRQPIGSPRTPYTRTLAPQLRTLYRPVAQLPQTFAARPLVPVSMGTYGRNQIPKEPSRNNIPDKPIPPGINQNKRNNIALRKQIPAKTPEERNYINGILIPQKVTKQAIKGPIKPQMNPSAVPAKPLAKPIEPQASPIGHKLSTFLKTVKNLQDTLKDNTMRQGLIYYDDDVSNKSRHRPTNFAPPTRKLGSMGSPGGSRVTFNGESATRPAIIPETKVVNQAGSERVNIAQTDKNVPNYGQETHSMNQNDQMSDTTEHALQIKKNAVAEKPLPKSASSVTDSQSKNTAGSARSESAAKVDLGLLKEKVLHSNNSQFLKRVLHVLRKYTKLMKSSMSGKNTTRNIPNASLAESNSHVLDTTQPGNVETEKALSESGADLSHALNSTKTAVKVFDMLNSATKESPKSPEVKEFKEETTKSKNSTLTENSSKKSESESNIADLMSSNKSTEQNSADENASKKETIETEKNLGKPAFSLERLKNGLERGNTID